MKTIRQVILILLICAMVLGLCACKDNGDAGDQDTSDTTAAVEDVSFFGYAVIRPSRVSEKLLDEISSFYGRTLMISGDRDSIYDTDDGIAADSEAREILIGNTNRPESKEALSQISENEFIVAVIGNKIVIAGKSDNTTIMAMNYFVENYLKTDSSGVLAGDLFYKGVADVAMLAGNGALNYTLVCSKEDDTAVIEMGKIYSTLRAATSLPVKTSYDDAAYDPNAKQILIGYTGYEETGTVADKTDIEGYSIDFVGNKIVIFGWTSAAIVKATDEFISLISSSSYVDDSGNMAISLIKEKRSASTVSAEYGDVKFYKDVPFDVNGKKVDRIYDAGDNAMMLYWAGTTADSFTAYAAQLTSMGFAEYHSVDNNSISATTYTKNNANVHVYYLKRTSELRAIVYYDMELPVKPYSYTKVCEPAVTQLKVDEEGGGMSYVIRLEDGTFVVIDGGNFRNNDLVSADNIYDLLVEQKPEGVDKLVITAWFVTHAHPDHLGGYKAFAASPYKDEVEVKRLVANDISDYVCASFDNNTTDRSPYYKDLSKLISGCVYVKGNTGQQFCFPGVTVDILYTPSDVYPDTIFEHNAGGSMAFRLTVNESETREEKTFMFLGDVTAPGAEIMVKMYKEDLKSDVVQIGHHGSNGGSMDFYKYCDSKLAFLPNTKEIDDGKNWESWPHVAWAMEHADLVVRAWQGNYTVWFGADAVGKS